VTTKADFAAFVERTLEEVVQFAEEYAHTVLPRKLKFRWLGHDAQIDDGIVEAIVGKVYVDPENIYPCVDIGVGDLSDDGSLPMWQVTAQGPFRRTGLAGMGLSCSLSANLIKISSLDALHIQSGLSASSHRIWKILSDELRAQEST